MTLSGKILRNKGYEQQQSPGLASEFLYRPEALRIFDILWIKCLGYPQVGREHLKLQALRLAQPGGEYLFYLTSKDEAKISVQGKIKFIAACEDGDVHFLCFWPYLFIVDLAAFMLEPEFYLTEEVL